MITVIVDGVKVASLPLWMVRHVIEDTVSRYPGKLIVVEVKQV